eukprot:COSAG01_NODE_7661_length_3109_cov_4.350498_2_plen_112_part_00
MRQREAEHGAASAEEDRDDDEMDAQQHRSYDDEEAYVDAGDDSWYAHGGGEDEDLGMYGDDDGYAADGDGERRWDRYEQGYDGKPAFTSMWACFVAVLIGVLLCVTCSWSW